MVALLCALAGLTTTLHWLLLLSGLLVVATGALVALEYAFLRWTTPTVLDPRLVGYVKGSPARLEVLTKLPQDVLAQLLDSDAESHASTIVGLVADSSHPQAVSDGREALRELLAAQQSRQRALALTAPRVKELAAAVVERY